MALTTDRMSVLRGRPPVRAGGRKGFKIAHCWSVRSLGYGFGFIPFLRSTPPFGTDSKIGVVAPCGQVNALRRSTWSLGSGKHKFGEGTDGESGPSSHCSKS